MRDTQRGRDRQREKQAPYGEPDAGLDPRTPGSRPEPKADAQPLSHPDAPFCGYLEYKWDTLASTPPFQCIAIW